jgi:hypothetical protein
MRHARWALLALLTFVPQSRAQQVDEDTERRIVRVMDRLRDEMYAYRQELEFFRRAPEYNDLIELRYRLRSLAVEVADPTHNDYGYQRRAAREMEQAARELYRRTTQLEQRINLGAPEEVHRRADQLEEHAVEVRVLIGRLYELDRVDDNGGRPGGPIGRPGAPGGRPRDPRNAR